MVRGPDAFAHVFDSRLLDSRANEREVTTSERWLGYLLGPLGAALLNFVAGSYLNIYFTDVLDLSGLWGGLFLALLPALCKALNVATFAEMGKAVDATHTAQGKARPWILASLPLLLVGFVALFAVPQAGETATIVWVFLAYTLFYSVAYTAYSTAHTLLTPLSTADTKAREGLSVLTNAQVILPGMVSAVLFPSFVLPWMGVDRGRWMAMAVVLACICGPLIAVEYFFTRERLNGDKPALASGPAKPMREQLRLCLRSRYWTLVMVFVAVSQLVNAFYNASVFYYCNWVLGSYNDGITQTLFYAVGNAPMGIGAVLSAPLCRRFGRRRAMAGGCVVSVAGSLLCLLDPRNLPLVLAGQAIKAFGVCPATYMTSALLADALDDVEARAGERADGFSSSFYNVLITLAGGASLLALNLLLGGLGYVAPTAAAIPVQNDAIQALFIAGALGSSAIGGVLMAAVLSRLPEGSVVKT